MSDRRVSQLDLGLVQAFLEEFEFFLDVDELLLERVDLGRVLLDSCSQEGKSVGR